MRLNRVVLSLALGVLAVASSLLARSLFEGGRLGGVPLGIQAAALGYGRPHTASVPRLRRGTPAFAVTHGLTLRIPLARPVLIAYHEASRNRSLRLTPLGRCVRNANRTKFSTPSPTSGPRFIVMSSRGRPHPATSAVDVAARPGDAVLSPVTGRVDRVKRYRLYHTYPDLRLSLAPARRPRLRVVLLHLTRARVRRGERIVAGVTVLGAARSFSFRSQVNDYVGPRIPHLHLEVKELGATRRRTTR